MLEGIECQAVGYSIETQVCFLKLKKNIFSVINVIQLQNKSNGYKVMLVL